MKNKKGFTLVELLVVIAIIAILAIVAMPKILDLFNDAKKDTFLIDVKGLYKAATQKYMSEALKGNKVNVFSSDGENKLDLDNDELEYYIVLDDDGKITYIDVTNGEYSIQTDKSDPSSLDKDDVSDEEIDVNNRPNTDPIQNISSTTANIDDWRFSDFVKKNSPTEIYFTITGHSTGTNISSDFNDPIYAWMEGTKMYVSAAEANKLIKAPVNLSGFFSGSSCSKLRYVEKIDARYLDTSNVTRMDAAFYETGYYATTFELDVSSWDTSKVTEMDAMFYDTGYKATTLNLGNLSNWDTSKVTDMSSMFFRAGWNASTFKLDLSNWDTSKVTDMSSMFIISGRNATTWDIGDLSSWDTSSVTNMNHMFSSAGYSSTTWDIGNISGWDTSNVTQMVQVFEYAGYNASTFKLDLSSWDTSQATNMANMFYRAGYNATTFEIKIPKRSNGTSDNTTSSLKGLSTSIASPEGRTFTLVD